MYLSRLTISPRSRDAQRDLSDIYRMHQRVMSAFPDWEGSGGVRAGMAVLYRLDADRSNGATMLLVQAGMKPNWTSLPESYLALANSGEDNPATKCIAPALENLRQGQVLQFRLRANPTRKVDTKSGPDGRRRNGRRVALGTETQQVEWLTRKGVQNGFHLVSVQPGSDVPAVKVSALEKHRGNGRSRTLTVASVLFEGVLRIDDVDKFRGAIRTGIGPSKSFGCGLMSIAPCQGAP